MKPCAPSPAKGAGGAEHRDHPAASRATPPLHRGNRASFPAWPREAPGLSKRGSGAGAPPPPPALAAGRPRRGSAHVAKPPVPPRERRAGGELHFAAVLLGRGET